MNSKSWNVAGNVAPGMCSGKLDQLLAFQADINNEKLHKQ